MNFRKWVKLEEVLCDVCIHLVVFFSGAQHGYNVPEVRQCELLPTWLQEDHRCHILECKDDKQLPEQMKRVLCDGYICMYQNKKLQMYT